MIRPAANAARSGSNAESPWAITSAFTKVSTLNVSASSVRAEVVLPAPLGPARTITEGEGSFTGLSPQEFAQPVQPQRADSLPPAGVQDPVPRVLAQVPGDEDPHRRHRQARRPHQQGVD